MGMQPARLAAIPTPAEKPAPPKKGYQLRQLFLQSKTLREVEKVIGVFNPKRVTLETRLQMLDNPTVNFSQAVLRAPITKGDWYIYSDDAKIAAFCDKAIRDVYHELALGASLAIPLGYQALEKVWVAKPLTVRVEDKADGSMSSFTMDQAWVYEKFKALDHVRHMLLVDREKDQWGGIRGIGLDDKPVDVGPENAALWSFLAPLKWGKLTGQPQLDKQYTPWWELEATNLFCDRYFEKKADGQYVAHAPAELDGPNGTKLDGFEFVQNALMAAKNGEAITLPGETDEKGNRLVDVQLLQDDKRGDMYHPRLEYLNLQIMRGALIADRAGSAGRGSGIGTGEAQVHHDMLQMLMEEILADFFKFLQEQVLKPLVVYNFGQKAWDETHTCIKSKGISNWMRDLYRVLIQQMTQFESALADGQVVRFYEYMDMVNIGQQIGIPFKNAKELGPLAHKRIDPTSDGNAPDGGRPQGNPGDSNVKGKGGRPGNDGKPSGNKGYNASLEAIKRLSEELKIERYEAEVKRLEAKHESERKDLQERLERAVDSAKAREAELARRAEEAARQKEIAGLLAAGAKPVAPQSIVIHHHAGDVNVPPQKIEVHAGDVNVKAGDVTNHVTLRPGEKTATITDEKGNKTQVIIRPADGGNA